jgi:MFS family permease
VTTPLFTYLFLMPNSPFLAVDSSLADRTTLLGITLSLYPLGQFIGSPIIGHFSDHFGRRPLLLLTTLCTALFYCGVAFGLSHALPLVVGVALFLAGLCEGNVALAQSSIADTVEDQQRAAAFGWVMACANIAHIIGPITGGLLASSSLVSWFRPATPYWLIAIMLVGMTLWIYLSFRETVMRDVSRRLHLFNALTNLKEVFTHRRLRPYYLLNFMIYLAMFGYFRAYPMYGSVQYQLSLRSLSFLIAYLSVPCLIVNVYAVRGLARRLPLLGITVLTAMLMGASLIIVLIPQPVSLFWVTLIPPTLLASICVTTSATLLSSRCTPTEQGQALGNNQALQEGSSAISALLTGALAGIAIWLPFLFYALLALFTGLFFYRKLHRSRV